MAGQSDILTSILTPYMRKITRVRTGCWTCKARRKKCGEEKPDCTNCLKAGKKCGGYAIKLSFDVDDSRHSREQSVDANGRMKYGFRGRPRFKENSLALKPIQDVSAVENSQLEPASNNGEIPRELSLFDNLDFLLYHSGIFDVSFPQIEDQEIKKVPNQDVSSFIETTDLYSITPSNFQQSEENMMLKHFFNKLLPLLDSHPQAPWPELALKYCDFEIARSCFISLSCAHLYESKGGGDFYRIGAYHLNTIMDHLMKFVNTDPQNPRNQFIAVKEVVGSHPTLKKKQNSFFAILLLIYVHIIFGVLESGRSALSRVFFKLFASITEDEQFLEALGMIEHSQTLICVLSWFDTINAIVSPDCRMPYCKREWYGTKRDAVSTSRMNGCPGEIFCCIADLCSLRNAIRTKKVGKKELIQQFNSIKFQLLNYRTFVTVDDLQDSDNYYTNLRAAQCWSLATYVKLLDVAQPDADCEIKQLVKEFIAVYKTLDPKHTVVTQMVWPLFLIGCFAETAEDRQSIIEFMESIYNVARMGCLVTMRKVVEEVWDTGISSEEILSGKAWLQAGIDFLPL